MATIVRMPSVLAGATEAAIAHWLVAPGDTVTAGTPIAEIETEKALVEYAAEQDGVIGRLVLGEGASGEIGDPIAVLLAVGETDADADAALGSIAGPTAPAGSQPEGTPSTAGRVGAEAPAAGAPGTPAPGTPASGAAAPGTAAAGTGTAAGAPAANGHRPGGRVFASPLVRKLAGAHGIDLAGLTGTGPNGRIVRRDLERYLAADAGAPAPQAPGTAQAAGTAPAAGATPGAGTAGPGTTAGAAAGGMAEHAAVRDDMTAAPHPPGGGTTPAGATLVPHTPMRRAIARRLTESKATVPHFYLVTEPVVDELLALRRMVNETSPVKVSVNDFVIAAAAAAFGDVPEANVTWSEEGLLSYRQVDIAVAVATDNGLVTPVLRGVEGLKLSAIARESAELARRARDRRLLQHELEGGTFAVSNLGMYGTVEFSAIINPPQSAILAVGAARAQPAVVDGEVRAATVMRATLSVDHRAIDGALAARWLAAFTTRMENPLGILI